MDVYRRDASAIRITNICKSCKTRVLMEELFRTSYHGAQWDNVTIDSCTNGSLLSRAEHQSR